MNKENPKVFISYSWENEDHNHWVKHFSEQLINDGVNAIIDQYDLTLGDRLPRFMEDSITNSDYVLIICTPIYKEKSDARTGGVGYEGHIISGELLLSSNERKFIPVIKQGNVSNALPIFLSGKLAIDLGNQKFYQNNYYDLITTLYGQKRKPQLGVKPAFIKDKHSHSHDTKEIKILGIITNKVTVPKMDGTRGSALYQIPFRLSSTPSTLWKELFINSWKQPPRFTTMHRPRIASVLGDQIILDGTTIEEVRDYHRETLLLCVQKANKEEKAILEHQNRINQEEVKKKEDHYSNVFNIVDNIEF